MKKGVLMVKVWMMKNGVQNLDIEKSYGCDKAMVSKFLKGERTSKGLTNHMIKIGCPKKLFKNGRVAA